MSFKIKHILIIIWKPKCPVIVKLNGLLYMQFGVDIYYYKCQEPRNFWKHNFQRQNKTFMQDWFRSRINEMRYEILRGSYTNIPDPKIPSMFQLIMHMICIGILVDFYEYKCSKKFTGKSRKRIKSFTSVLRLYSIREFGDVGLHHKSVKVAD